MNDSFQVHVNHYLLLPFTSFDLIVSAVEAQTLNNVKNNEYKIQIREHIAGFVSTPTAAPEIVYSLVACLGFKHSYKY
jgi:hypothetical protein